jgi:hypothetical protein
MPIRASVAPMSGSIDNDGLYGTLDDVESGTTYY